MKPSLFFWALALVMVGAAPAAAAAHPDELAALPNTLVVELQGGQRLVGAPARIDIKHPQAGAAPRVEVVLWARSAAGEAWSAHAIAPAGFLAERVLQAAVSDRSLLEGQASVQHAIPLGELVFAASGRLELSLQGGRLSGTVTGADQQVIARFEGPVSMTCAVPAATLTGGLASPQSETLLQALLVDTNFESALCKPHAGLRVSVSL
jgi:hypothetical protein